MKANSQSHASAAIIAAVESTADCSDKTIKSLKKLLALGATEDRQLQDNVGQKAPKTPVPQTKTKKQHTKAVEIYEDLDGTLPPRERLSLATNVVNTSLQVLGNIVRSQGETPPTKDRETIPNAERFREDKSQSQAPRPSNARRRVKEVSSNRISISPIATEPSKSNPPTRITSNSRQRNGTEAIVECARVSFEYLRAIFPAVYGTDDSDEWLVEHGMISFIGKLLGLRFDAVAAKELKSLKRRLEARIRRSNVDGTTSKDAKSDPTRSAEASTRETLVTLLHMEFEDQPDKILRLIVSYQTLVLRTIATAGRPQVIESLKEHIRPECPYSPIHLIQRCSRSSDASSGSALLLDQLSQILLSLCPKLSASADHDALDPTKHASPEICLWIQSLALRTRWMWMNLSGHEGSFGEDILKHYEKLLNAFLRRSSARTIDNYWAAKSCLQLIATDVDGICPKKEVDMRTTDKSSVYRQLSRMAEQSCVYSEARVWLELLADPGANCETSPVEKASVAYRLATVSICEATHSCSPLDLERLGLALMYLKTIPTGTTKHAEQMLFDLLGLSRAACGFVKAYSDPSRQTHVSGHQKEFEFCNDVVQSCLKGYVQLHASKLRQQDDYGASDTQSGTKIVSTTARSSIECVATSYLQIIEAGIDAWDSAHSTFRLCVELLRSIHKYSHKNNSDENETVNAPSLAVILSNALFKLHTKAKGRPPEQYLSSLELSCNILTTARTSEKRHGNLLPKLERLAKLFHSEGQQEQARHTYLILIEVWSEIRVEPSTEAERQPLPVTWKRDTQLATVTDALRYLLKPGASTTAKSSSDQVPIDNESFKFEDRGVFLEWQLDVVAININSYGLSAHTHDLVCDISNRLFALYQGQLYLGQRQRVSLFLLTLATDIPESVPSSVLSLAEECALSCGNEEPSCSGSLSVPSPHLQLCLSIILLFRGSQTGEERLEQSLIRYTQLLQSLPSWNDLSAVVGDTDSLLERLSSVFQFIGSKGHQYLQLSIARLVFKLHEQRLQVSPNGFVKASVQFSLQLLRLGYSELAGIYLLKGQSRLQSSNVLKEECLEFNLAYAEYFLTLGDLSQCSLHLERAEDICEEFLMAGATERLSSRLAKIQSIAMNADVRHLRSRIELLKGSFAQALWFARQELALLQSAWKSLERRYKFPREDVKCGRPEEHELVGAFEKLDLSTNKQASTSPEPGDAYGPLFWPLIPRLSRAFFHLSELYQYSGLLNDATYHLDQALRLAEDLKANHTIAATLVHKGDCIGRSGNAVMSWDCLERASKLYAGEPEIKDAAILQQAVGHFHRLQRQWKTEAEAYDAADTIVTKLMQPNFTRQLEGKIDGLGNDQSTATGNKAVKSLSKKKPTKSHHQHSQKASSGTNTLRAKDTGQHTGQQSDAPRHFIFTNLQKNLLRLRAESFLLQGSLDASGQLVSRFKDEISKGDHDVGQRLCQCKQLVYEATKILAADGIYGMIAESPISLPSTLSSVGETEDEKSHIKNCAQEQRAHKISRQQSKAKTLTNAVHNFQELLRQALDMFSLKAATFDNISTLPALRQAATILTSAAVMLSSVKLACADPNLHPVRVGLIADIPQSAASGRDQAVSLVETTQKRISQSERIRENSMLINEQSLAGVSDVHDQFIDCIPESWTIISVSLDDSHNHLHLTKYRSNKRPFVLRLPLTRQNAEDAEQESFTFAEAKSELLEIVKLSDATVHAARDNADEMKRKPARAQWWSEREALDSRLRDLLLNMENMWFGGFRGFFSDHQPGTSLLLRFQQSFENILEKHLPSRQARKRSTDTHIRLDPQVVGLFVGLVKSEEDIDDLDEALTDLLYYVVDILQFKGEANAYDEIDFDAITVEVQDALRSYFEASHAETSPDMPRHTILVLDKNIHGFPWESLSCLEGTSVSRLYSLVELQERVTLMQEQKNFDKRDEGIFSSSARGSIILNPSGDLKKTQGRFEKTLSTLSQESNSWVNLTGRVPTEEEFAAALFSDKDSNSSASQNSVLLYFGHGSGAQYIRHRRIKQLRFQHLPSDQFSNSSPPKDEDYSEISEDGTDRATPAKVVNSVNPGVSTTLLFGCSSASLREHLEFEPHGTPKSYMLAGAPALLGSLWDVTDGDIDKFAGGVLERWGLFAPGTFAELREESTKSRSKGRGKGKSANVGGRGLDADETRKLGQDGPSMSLTEAAAKSRGDCYLKYLNGAAMVVYGVPVYLTKT